jgi:hypothetical protein
MKQCFKCGRTLSKKEFYAHKGMADGLLGKCKSCTKADVRERSYVLREDPVWMEEQRIRGREKYHRLQYKSNTDPIKSKAHSSAQHLPCASEERHHWSYKKEHWKDVIPLTRSQHKRLHAAMRYDENELQYRDAEGNLLNSRVKHEALLWRVCGC